MNINGGNFKEYPTEEMMKGFKKGLKGTFIDIYIFTLAKY